MIGVVKMGLKMCKVTVGTRQKEYPDGTPYGEIVKDFDQDCRYPVVLVTVDGKLRELHKKIHRDCQISLVTVADSIGHKTYKRSMNLLLLKAIYHVAGHEKIRKIVLHFTVGTEKAIRAKGTLCIRWGPPDCPPPNRLRKNPLWPCRTA